VAAAHEVQLAAGRWFIDLTLTWGFIDWRRLQMVVVPGTNVHAVSYFVIKK